VRLSRASPFAKYVYGHSAPARPTTQFRDLRNCVGIFRGRCTIVAMAALGERMSVSDALQSLLLEMGQQRALDGVLRVVVDRLAEEEQIALGRIWLLAPGDICPKCPMRAECPDQTRCLHLVSSAGRSRNKGVDPWTRLDGDFRRMPLGARKVGRIAASGECVSVMDIQKNAEWIARPDWARAEGIRGFAGQPLVFKGEILGVLAIVTRTPLSQACLDWLRTIADLAAASIANTRAYEEIESLRAQLELENAYLREEVSEARAFGDIIGQSPALRNIIQQIELVAPTDASVLILGESGTGKELVAQEIHRRSARSARAMVRVNCASVPRELYESEFFGHVKGAFTGAVRDRAGRFELANGGTLFLDEVATISATTQVRLLRVVQECELERVGGEETIPVDVRIIAATNRDLGALVDSGKFREDFYYRLNEVVIYVPPLRERKEDIPLLVDAFVNEANSKFDKEVRTVSDIAMNYLLRHDWPGNVRELENLCRRAATLCTGDTLTAELIVPWLSTAAPVLEGLGVLRDGCMLEDMERSLIERTLARFNGHRAKSAKALGMGVRTLGMKLKQWREEVDRQGTLVGVGS